MLKSQNKVVKSARNYVNILGVKLDSTSVNKVLNTMGVFWQSMYKFRLFTPNPEILIEANADKNFRKILNLGDINVPDGVGLSYASKFLYGKTLNIIPGRKLFLEIIKTAEKNNRKVFLLGGLGNEVILTKEKLERNFKGLRVKCLKGPRLDNNGKPLNKIDEKEEKEAVEGINEFNPDILFVGFGVPKQEKWIHQWLPKLKVGGAMAVGGTFSYIAGFSKLPPKWMENRGLEWFWRLLHEPKRVSRMLRAIVVFPVKVVWSSIFRTSCH